MRSNLQRLEETTVTPTTLLVVLLLTWVTVTIVDWFNVLTARGRPVLIILALVFYAVWVVGFPIALGG